MPRSYKRSDSRNRDYGKGDRVSVKSREDSRYHHHYWRHHRDDRDSYDRDYYDHRNSDTSYRGRKRSREFASDEHLHDKRVSEEFAERARGYRESDEFNSHSNYKFAEDYDKLDKKNVKSNQNEEAENYFRSGLMYSRARGHVGEQVGYSTTATSHLRSNGSSSRGNTEQTQDETKVVNDEDCIRHKAVHDRKSDDLKEFSDKNEKESFVEANKEDCITINENTSAEEIYDRLCVYHDVPLPKNASNTDNDGINYASNVNLNSKLGAVLLPPGWEKVEYQDSTVYLDHIAREAHEEAPWIVWRRRADKYNFTA